MIGVLPKAGQERAVEEFFELFKTPWEMYRPGRSYDVVIATATDIPQVQASLIVLYGVEAKTLQPGARVVRAAYDLFDEVRVLLTAGQPAARAHVPTLDVYIDTLRRWIVDAGVPLLEIPPSPAGYRFTVCLTHDIDFVGIRRHLCDHTMWGFLYRATFEALRKYLRGRLAFSRLMKCWRAAASLPFVYLGWARDFWDPFQWYLGVERGLPATYFVIPYKRRQGEHVPGPHAHRRAAAYDVLDIADATKTLVGHGCEVGVHGIDAWTDAGLGIAERKRVAGVTGQRHVGVRMHWLLSDRGTAAKLEHAGYSYDATCGYNETIGYRCGTTLPFRPLTTNTLMELPLHIQDGALFYPHNLNLDDDEAEARCRPLIEHARSTGGVLTVLWHDRSHAAERFWGDFYVAFVRSLRASNAWFATASQAVGWFRARRQVRFERVDGAQGSGVRVRYDGQPVDPPMTLRRHAGTRTTDAPWNGAGPVDVMSALPIAS